jgi:hypothetical protein
MFFFILAGALAAAPARNIWIIRVDTDSKIYNSHFLFGTPDKQQKTGAELHPCTIY